MATLLGSPKKKRVNSGVPSEVVQSSGVNDLMRSQDSIHCLEGTLLQEGSSNMKPLSRSSIPARQESWLSGWRLPGPTISTHLPEQHSQQQEDEDSHQQADGNDPTHDVASWLQIVQRLEDHLGGKARVSWCPRRSTHRMRGSNLGLTLRLNRRDVSRLLLL